MADYSFKTITAVEALSFDATVDTLSDIYIQANGYRVAFEDDAGRLTLTDVVTGHSVVFGAGIYGADVGGPSKLIYIGTPGDDFVSARPERSYIFAGAGDDIIFCGSTWQVSGGSGHDTFVATSPNRYTTISDWEAGDRLYLSAQPLSAANYVEASLATTDDDLAYIKGQFAAGKNYVVVAQNGKLTVYHHDDGAADFTYNVVILPGHGLDDLSPADFATGPLPAGSTAPVHPGPTTVVSVEGDMDAAHLSSLLGGEISQHTSTTLVITSATTTINGITVTGSGLTYDANAQITGGIATSISYSYGDPFNHPEGYFRFTADAISVSAANFSSWVGTDATQAAFETVLAGADKIFGSRGADLIRGFGGDDLIAGFGGIESQTDTIFGGLGNDVIYAGTFPEVSTVGLSAGSTYLRGDEGDDWILGGDGFDDINGNMGADTAAGGRGDDWVVGGKDNDSLSGGDGFDIVYGNIGADTIAGDAGNDIVRGGQGDDVVLGGLGADFLSGDRGDDTITGGLGADTFHTFGEAGIDRILDFKAAEGDHVQLDPGTIYAVAQVGGDTVISMTGGGQMVLVGVSLNSLPPGWIFSA